MVHLKGIEDFLLDEISVALMRKCFNQSAQYVESGA